MSQAIKGAAAIGGAIALGITAFALASTGVGFAALPFLLEASAALAVGGLAMEAGAIAAALSSNRGANITVRQPASYRQIIYGTQRVGGVLIYQSTTGSHHDQVNHVIVIAGHVCNSIVNVYLDGRQVHFQVGSVGNQTRNGVNFGGSADGGTYTGPGGAQYNFGGKVYFEACYGEQTNQPNTVYNGGFNTGLQANDRTWSPSAQGIPYVGGCTYVYFKYVYDSVMFPQPPEVRFTVRGKSNIFDPRTGTTGYTSNAALILADVFTDAQFGLGDNSVNQAQLIAAANICDEQVPLASGGTESRYACHYHYDTSKGPGAALQEMLPAMGGRFTRCGGEWYLWPAAWIGPSYNFDENALAAGFVWNPTRDRRDLVNRLTGTYTAPNYPYNATTEYGSNLYNANGFYDGTIQNNFGFAFQSTSIPYYAADVLHGYAANQYINDDGQLLQRDMPLPCVLSVSQAQRLLKIALLRNRHQGSGEFMMFPVAFQMAQMDVMTFSMNKLGWTSKVLEINSVSLGVAPGENGVPCPQVKVGVNETSASVYAWSIAEELSIYLKEIAPSRSYIPYPPTNLTLTSSAATALVGLDGIVHPRVLVSWDEPLDTLVNQIEVQYLPGTPGTNTITAGLEARTNWLQPGNVGDLPTGGNTSHTGGYGTYTPASGSVGYGIFHAYPNYDYQGLYFYENEPSSFNTMVNFTSTKMIQIPTSGDLAACQALDFEIQVSRAGWTYNGAWEQAPFVSNGSINGVWQYFNYQGTNAPNAHWVPTIIPISASFVAGQWVAIVAKWRIDPVAHTMTHVSLSINGTVYPVNATQPATQEGFANYLHASQQLNCRQGVTSGSNYTPPASYQTWVKAWSITMDDGGGNAASWLPGPTVGVQNTSCYVSDVVAGQQYSFRIRSVRPGGAISPWDELDGYTVSVTLSTLTQTGVGVGSLVGEVFSITFAGTTTIVAAIICGPFTAQIGAAAISVLPNSYTISGLNQAQLYYVYYVDPTFVGGNVTPVATQNQADFRGKLGYFFIDSIVTPSYRSSTGSGARFSPSDFSDTGTRTTGSPQAAYDGDVTTFAAVSALYDHVMDRGNFGQCSWQHFQSYALPASATMHVIAAVSATSGSQIPCSIVASIAGTTTTMLTANATTASADYTIAIPSGTNLNSIFVTALADATAASSTTNLTSSIKIAEIYIQ